MPPIDDTALARSWQLKVETVPTLIRFEAGREISRVAGWDRAEWQRVAGLPELGAALPAFQPGCGSHTMDRDTLRPPTIFVKESFRGAE